MRLTTILPAVLAATVSADIGPLGFALGSKKPDGSCKFQSDYEADFDTISSLSKIVRGYDASDCNYAQNILPAAKNKGFKVILGIWPDTDASFASGVGALKQYVPQFKEQVYAVTVGSETLYRRNFTGEQLVDKMNQVRGMLPDGTKIGTADTWDLWANGTADAVIKSADIALANAFPYWQGQDIKNATASLFDSMQQALKRVQTQRPSGSPPLEFWTGETGWPTGGVAYEAAQPGIDNAQTFWKSAICGLRNWNVNVFSFEAFDEPWKPLSTGTNGQTADETHWGVFNADRSTKYDIKC